MLAKDLMSSNPECLEVGSYMVEAIRLMQKHRFGSVVIVKNGRYQGIVTQNLVILALFRAGWDGISNMKVEDFMRDASISENDSIEDVCQSMVMNSLDHVAVVKGNKPVGVISVKDILFYLPVEPPT